MAIQVQTGVPGDLQDAHSAIESLLEQHSMAATDVNHLQVLSNLMQVQAATGADLSSDVMDQLHQALHETANPKQPDMPSDNRVEAPTPEDASTADSQPEDVSTDPPPGMLITPLGGVIINSSTEPVATIDHMPVLPTASSLNSLPDPAADVVASNVVAVNPTAPQDAPHASVWQDALHAGRTSEPMVVNGTTLEAPALVTTDSAGNVVTVPMSLAVAATSTSIPIRSIDPDIRTVTHLPNLSGLMPTPPQDQLTATIPPTLLAGGDQVPPGFVLSGTICLFGQLQGEHYSFHGTAGDEMTEMVHVSKQAVGLDELLGSGSFGNIELQNPTIVIYPPSSTRRAPGVWLDARVGLDGALADVAVVLKDISASPVTSIDVSIYLGGAQSLSEPIKPTDLLVTATLPEKDIKIGKFIELSSVGIELRGNRGSWTATLHGQVLLTVPGSVAPLTATYTVRKAQSYSLEIQASTWTDAMGVPGFHLDDAVITSTFTEENKNKAFTFDINASLGFGSTTVAVTGHYASDGWDFHATMGDLTLSALESAFAKLFGGNLSVCPHDVVLSGVTLDVNSNNKALLLTGGVQVDGYSCAEMSLELASTGVHLTGDLHSVTFDAVTLAKAQIELVITKEGLVHPDPAKPGTTTAFTITGEVQASSVTIDAVVAFDKAPGAPLAWVVYAKATINHHLSDFVHVPADLDFGLENVVVMASNASTFSQTFDYPVRKGFQLYAKVDCPNALAKSMHTAPGSMTLELDLGSTEEIVFHFAAPQNLTLKRGMVAPDVKAGIQLSGTPQVFIEGDLPVILPGQPGPLTFGLRLQAGPTEAQASASLLTDWVNPFNISPRVKVLAPVTLGVIIDYVAATYPSGLNFAGGFQIGETILKAAFEVGENPSDGVLLVEAENLGIRDIVSFISSVIDHPLPMPSDFLFFKDLSFGISSGGSIGAVYYPPGATFDADLFLFGKEVKINAAVDRSLPGFTLHGEIEAFNLGPLVVSGNTQKNPVLDLQFGPKIQHILLDGKIALFDFDLAITLKMDMVPLDLDFEAELKFSDLLLFKVRAHVEGDIHSVKDVVHADFSFYADFEQSILDHMMALANTYIAAAKKAADEGLESAQSKLDQTEKSFNDHLAKCQRDFADAQARWEKKSADVHAAVQARRTEVKKDEATKRQAVADAHNAFNKKIAALQHNLDQTKADAANKIKVAQNNLNQSTADANAKVDAAVKKLHDAEQDMKNRFGDADRKINDAQGKVQGAQRAVNDLQRQVDHCNWEIHHGSVGDRIKASFQIAGLGIALGGAKAGLGTAQGVLQAAYGIVNSAGYQVAQGALKASEGTLQTAKATADAGILVAKGTLSAAQATANASIGAAEASLNAAKTGCDELHVWKFAEDALTSYLKVEDGLLAAADKMEQDLSKAAEKVVFDAANAALAVARSATKELDAAKAVIAEVEKGVDHVLALGKWLVDHAGNIFNLKQVELGGNLSGASNKQPFLLHIRGTFADCPVDVHAEFVPGAAEDMVKKLVLKWLDEAKADLTKFIKH